MGDACAGCRDSRMGHSPVCDEQALADDALTKNDPVLIAWQHEAIPEGGEKLPPPGASPLDRVCHSTSFDSVGHGLQLKSV